MRDITSQAIEAFKASRNFKCKNTEVVASNETHLLLHGNLIAKKIDGEIFISNAGWFSNTTKERLNGLPNVSIQQIKGKWYLNGSLWDGQWIKVN